MTCNPRDMPLMWLIFANPPLQDNLLNKWRVVQVLSNSKKVLRELYTDGSYCEKNKIGAWGYAYLEDGIILNERYEIAESHSSSHLELLAVINGLVDVKDAHIRIYTDSQYVRKGITEWIFHWRENNYMTANGTRAKNIDDWKLLDKIISERYIEWCWIKGHRANEIHNRVDLKVGQTSRRS